jgi:hypothetical protein
MGIAKILHRHSGKNESEGLQGKRKINSQPAWDDPASAVNVDPGGPVVTAHVSMQP